MGCRAVVAVRYERVVEAPASGTAGTIYFVKAAGVSYAAQFIAGNDGKLIPVGAPATAPGGTGGGDMFKADNLSGLSNYDTARSNLGVAAAGQDAAYAARSSNLSDLANAGTARGNLGLGALAVKSTVSDADWSGADLSIGNGGTGSSSAPAARAALGLGSAAVLDGGVSAGNAPVLDSGGKLLTSVLPEAILGAMKYQGVWNASTNSPALASTPAAATKGFYYVVSVAGSPSLSGITDWKVGDWAVSNGTSWDKVDSSDQVASVAGLMGVITAANLVSALGLVIGTNVQAWDADLDAIAALSTTSFGRAFLTLANAAAGRSAIGAAAVTDLVQSINVTAAADVYVPARVAQTIAQGNSPLGTGTVAYTKNTTAAPGTFNSVTLPVNLAAGEWLKVSITAVTGFYALDLYRSA